MEPAQQPPAPLAVILDMDGVLVDSVPTLVPSYNSVLSRHGCAMTFEEFQHYNGWRLVDIIAALNTRFSLRLDADAVRTEVNAFQLGLLAKSSHDYEPERRLISKLHACGIKMAVATASSRKRAEDFLAICGYDAFDAMVTGEDVAAGKPSPDIFLEAARRLGVEPARCIVVEDGLNGIEAARRAGMRAVGVIGTHRREELEANADLVVGRLGELTLEQIEGLLSVSPASEN